MRYGATVERNLDWRVCFIGRAPGGDCDYLVAGIGGDEAAGMELGWEEGKVVLDGEDGRLCVKMPNAGHLHAADCDTEGRVLEGLGPY